MDAPHDVTLDTENGGGRIPPGLGGFPPPRGCRTRRGQSRRTGIACRWLLPLSPGLPGQVESVEVYVLVSGCRGEQEGWEGEQEGWGGKSREFHRHNGNMGQVCRDKVRQIEKKSGDEKSWKKQCDHPVHRKGGGLKALRPSGVKGDLPMKKRIDVFEVPQFEY